MAEHSAVSTPLTEKPGIKGYIALFLFIISLSGLLKDIPVIQVFDFNNMLGAFGVVKGAEGSFQGAGGFGAKEGFMVAFAQIPLVMFAMGIVAVVTHYKALLAAQTIFTPLLRPCLGIPGVAGLTFVTNLNTSDGAAIMTADLSNNGYLTEDERTIFVGYQLPASGMIVATVTLIAMAPDLLVSPAFVFAVLLVMKFVSGNLVRLFLALSGKKGRQTAGENV